MSDQYVGPFIECAKCGNDMLALQGNFWCCTNCGVSYGERALSAASAVRSEGVVLVKRLEAKAENCADNARAETLVVDAFKDQYLAGLSDQLKDSGLSPEQCKERHDRSLRIYDFYIGGQRRAKNFTEDAELFRSAANALALLSQPEPKGDKE
jgi:hypothetical protein